MVSFHSHGQNMTEVDKQTFASTSGSLPPAEQAEWGKRPQLTTMTHTHTPAATQNEPQHTQPTPDEVMCAQLLLSLSRDPSAKSSCTGKTTVEQPRAAKRQPSMPSIHVTVASSTAAATDTSNDKAIDPWKVPDESFGKDDCRRQS